MFSFGGDYSAHLLDADGVVLNEDYHKGRKEKDLPHYSEEKNILDSNQSLMKVVADSINTAGDGQIASFSMRIDPYGEQCNADKYKTSSYCKALSTVIHPEIQRLTENRCKLEKQLVSDIWNKEKPGRAFEVASLLSEETLLSKKILPGDAWVPADMTKFSILYANIQKIIADKPDKKELHITVWDDAPTIVYTLSILFPAKLIPKKMTLHFIQHRRRDKEFAAAGLEPKGDGQPNPFYEATLRAFYKSKEYQAFEDDMSGKAKPDFQFGKLFPPMVKAMEVLHEKALDFWQKLTAGEIDLTKEMDDYERDMFSSYVQKHPKKTISVIAPTVLDSSTKIPADTAVDECKSDQPAVDIDVSMPSNDVQDALNAYANKKMTKPELITTILQKIQEKSTSAEVRVIIETLQAEANRAVVHDKKSEAGWSFFNYTWYGQPISKTFNDLVKMAKCKMLELYAKDQFDHPDKQKDNQVFFSQADRQFLQKDRHWKKFGNTQSFTFFKDLSHAEKRGKTRQKITESFNKHSQAVKKRYHI